MLRKTEHTFTEVMRRFDYLLDIHSMECGIGWMDIIYNALEEISQVENSHIIITYIGEEMGLLDIKYAVNFEANVDNSLIPLSKIDEILNQAKSESAYTCEYCGGYGMFRYKEWYRVTCEDCEDENF